MSDRSSPARWLAPLALVACTAAVLVVVSGGGGDDGATGGAPASTTVTSRTAAKQEPKRRFYTVESGDVLSAIAQRTGVPVETLMQLNPDVDAQTLRPGQRLRLRR